MPKPLPLQLAGSRWARAAGDPHSRNSSPATNPDKPHRMGGPRQAANFLPFWGVSPEHGTILFGSDCFTDVFIFIF
jgi:hypothetical protein